MAQITLDMYEYATSEAAQAAYVSSDDGLVDSYSETNMDNNYQQFSGNDEQVGQAITLPDSLLTSCKFYCTTYGSPTGSVYAKLYAATGTVGTDAVPTGAILATSDAVDISVITDSYTLITFTFSTPYDASAGDYCIMIEHTGGNEDNFIRSAIDTSSPTHDGNSFRTPTAGSGWASSSFDMIFYLYGTPKLQCYSESSIKNQGNYSLKAVAAITDSLNDTLTKSGLSIDLSGVNTLKYDIYSASRTGSHIKIAIHDSGGTTTEHTANISSTGGWETQTIDLSGVVDANKDDIDSIIITIVNADAANTFYVDNFYAPEVIENAVFFGVNQ